MLMNPDLIRAGDLLKIFTGKFAVAVSKSRNDLVLYMNGQFFKRYPVGTGQYGKTPTGTFKITERIKEPVWWRPDGKEIPYGDPQNILGTRWMTLRATGETPDVKGYGIHGTWDESSIGKAESAGCVRMKNGDVEELFALVPVGTTVTITD
jgi:lipoprotein-anchoring transpeptidase ErfK/SrfK